MEERVDQKGAIITIDREAFLYATLTSRDATSFNLLDAAPSATPQTLSFQICRTGLNDTLNLLGSEPATEPGPLSLCQSLFLTACSYFVGK